MVASAGGMDGDRLRQAVANYGCPEASDIIHYTYDDRGHPIAKTIQTQCEADYRRSWFSKRMRRQWICPPNSEFSQGWCDYGLASLCEELIRRGVKVA